MSATSPASRGTSVGFAPPDDVPIPYMQRTRDYYLALGFGADIIAADILSEGTQIRRRCLRANLSCRL